MLSKPGREGGRSAAKCENPIGQHVHHDDAISLHAAGRLADIDMQHLIKTTRGGGARRGCPHWEVPLELWSMILHPQNVRGEMKTGLGFDTKFRLTGVIRDRLWTLLQSIRLKASTPTMFDASSGFRVPKKAVRIS